MNGPGLRIEEAVGGRAKKGSTKMQEESFLVVRPGSNPSCRIDPHDNPGRKISKKFKIKGVRREISLFFYQRFRGRPSLPRDPC